MIVLIDNYDSFTYNLYQEIGELYGEVEVFRNDEITLGEIEKMAPQAIVISPGPGYPDSAGISVDAVRTFSGRIPILGVCLGHQAIAEAFGGKIVRAGRLMHGKASSIAIKQDNSLFYGLPETVLAARYHSLIVDESTLPGCLEITARDESGQIMAVSHTEHPTYGVQFHPESILTKSGQKMLENFLDRVAHVPVRHLDFDETLLPPEQRNLLKPYIFKVIEGTDLSQDEAYEAMDCIMSGGATDAQIGSFITALRMKGETIDEITGFARVMRNKAAVMPHSAAAIDIVGTGGDLANTFNISTTAAFVAAGAGLPVAKHGNRSVSSKSGSADVLEALGVKIDMTPAQASECLDSCGLSFLFAQKFHGSMKFAALPRKQIGVRSVFNILGPLANPAFTRYMLIGVYDEALMEPMAKVLQNLGVKGAMVVHGSDGLDEITISGTTKICEIKGSKLIKYELDPRDYGVRLADLDEVVGGTAEENAQITLAILSGQERGAKRDIVLLNAACALVIAGNAEDIGQGLSLAQASVDTGAAMEKLEELKARTCGFGKETP
ncbi:bifunctional anthranilate synthase component II/anthranilate phosphoribosyltransferase [Christensenella tenuis]|uniref:Anthranilate phosphoribosyltransferase n=1 Tax=Christensenella tenuis TaxID=2763033 RepID=A0ABR7EDQ9_9FIRM|nr:bifunctional anthranilate synthase component II/anthranilate phosphoribosyltransferase [Christensenella tenuis]MBC5647922.1 bifunctional anthranilate synthase component II/anthranilate phosphoribosyltransferase [Christensenella tenuis]